jgi:hypothetical protein
VGLVSDLRSQTLDADTVRATGSGFFVRRLSFAISGLWHDFVSQGNEFLRTELDAMRALPIVCPIHAVPMEDDCDHCRSQSFPTSMRTSRGFRGVR